MSALVAQCQPSPSTYGNRENTHRWRCKCPPCSNGLWKTITTAEQIDPYADYFMPNMKLGGFEVLKTILTCYWPLLRTRPYPKNPAATKNNHIKLTISGYAARGKEGEVLGIGSGKRPATYDMAVELEAARSLRSTWNRGAGAQKKRKADELSGDDDKAPSVNHGGSEFKDKDKGTCNVDEQSSESEDEIEVKHKAKRSMHKKTSVARRSVEPPTSQVTKSRLVGYTSRKPRCHSQHTSYVDPDHDDDEDDCDEDCDDPKPETKKLGRKAQDSPKSRDSRAGTGRIISCIGCRWTKKGRCEGSSTPGTRVIGEACVPCSAKGGRWKTWCANDSWPQEMRHRFKK